MHQIFTPNGWKWNVELLSDWITFNLNKPFLHTLVINNSTPTTISATNTHYKSVGTFVTNPLSRGMTSTNGQFMHLSTETFVFEISAIVSVSAGNNQVIGLHLGKNGTAYQYTETLTTTSGSGKSENIALKRGDRTIPNRLFRVVFRK
jgi:hypothetical protein